MKIGDQNPDDPTQRFVRNVVDASELTVTSDGRVVLQSQGSKFIRIQGALYEVQHGRDGDWLKDSSGNTVLLRDFPNKRIIPLLPSGQAADAGKTYLQQALAPAATVNTAALAAQNLAFLLGEDTENLPALFTHNPASPASTALVTGLAETQELISADSTFVTGGDLATFHGRFGGDLALPDDAIVIDLTAGPPEEKYIGAGSSDATNVDPSRYKPEAKRRETPPEPKGPSIVAQLQSRLQAGISSLNGGLNWTTQKIGAGYNTLTDGIDWSKQTWNAGQTVVTQKWDATTHGLSTAYNGTANALGSIKQRWDNGTVIADSMDWSKQTWNAGQTMATQAWENSNIIADGTAWTTQHWNQAYGSAQEGWKNTTIAAQPHIEAAQAAYEGKVKPAVQETYQTRVKPVVAAAPGKIKEVAKQAGGVIKTIVEVAPPLAEGLIYEARRNYHQEAEVRLEETRYDSYANQAEHFDLRQTLERLSEIDFTGQEGITGEDIKKVLPPLLASLDRFRADDVSQLAILQERDYRRALENLVLVATNYNEPSYRGQAAGILSSLMKHSVREARIHSVSDDAFDRFLDIIASGADEAQRHSASAKFIQVLNQGSGTLEAKLGKFINFLGGAFEGNLGKIFSEPLLQGAILKDVHVLLADPLSILEEVQPEAAEIESQSHLRSQQIQAGDDISAAARSVFESHLSQDIDPAWREATLAVVRARTDDEVAEATDAFMGQLLNVFKVIVSKSSNIEQTGHLISLADNHLSLGLASEGFIISDTSDSLSLRQLLLSVYNQGEIDRVRQLNSGKPQDNYDHFIMDDSVKQRLEAKLSIFKREHAQEKQGLNVNLMTLSKSLDDMAIVNSDGEKQPGFAAIFTQRVASKLGDGLILKDLADMPDNETLLNPQLADLDTMPKDGIKRLLIDALAEKRQAHATFQKLQLEQLASITGGGESSVSVNLFQVAKEALDKKNRNFRAAAAENGVVAELLRQYDSYKSSIDEPGDLIASVRLLSTAKNYFDQGQGAELLKFITFNKEKLDRLDGFATKFLNLSSMHERLSQERHKEFHLLLDPIMKATDSTPAFNDPFVIQFLLEEGNDFRLLSHLISHSDELNAAYDGLGTKLIRLNTEYELASQKKEKAVGDLFAQAVASTTKITEVLEGESGVNLLSLLEHREDLDREYDGLGTKLFSMHIEKTKKEITIANKFIEALVAEKKYYAGVGDKNYSLAGLLPEGASLMSLGFSLNDFSDYRKLSELEANLNKAHFRMEKMVDSASASPVDVANNIAGDLGESLTETLQPMLHVLGNADSGTTKLLHGSLAGIEIIPRTSTHSSPHSLAEKFMAAIMNLLVNFLSSPNDRAHTPALSYA